MGLVARMARSELTGLGLRFGNDPDPPADEAAGIEALFDCAALPAEFQIVGLREISYRHNQVPSQIMIAALDKGATAHISIDYEGPLLDPQKLAKGYISRAKKAISSAKMELIEKHVPDLNSATFEKPLVVDLTGEGDGGKRLLVHEEILFSSDKAVNVLISGPNADEVAALTRWAQTIKLDTLVRPEPQPRAPRRRNRNPRQAPTPAPKPQTREVIPMSLHVRRARAVQLSWILLAAAMAVRTAVAAEPVFKAGFAERDITPAVGAEQPGGYGKSFNRSIHDPCKVRAAVFDDGSHRVALVGIDALFIRRPAVVAARRQIEAGCGIPAASVMIAASHTHSGGPMGMIYPGEYDHGDELVRKLAYEMSSLADNEYLRKVETAIAEAVCDANEHRTAARAAAGLGRRRWPLTAASA